MQRLLIANIFFSAVYACPVCEEPKSGWQIPQKERQQREEGLAPIRTLHSLKKCYVAYIEDGAQQNRARFISKSVVRQPIFPIEPSEVPVHYD